jgi:hypothetical protein
MEPETKRTVTKTILLLVALLGVGSVAIGVFLDEQSFANMLLGVTMLESLISVIVVFFLSDRNQV